ncbi:MAG TPA: hypothetical protein VGS19_35855 [Streptosporangiaceae bacterium]|nr:hypothetical protein [Streptosporangiaceae bacterium]
MAEAGAAGRAEQSPPVTQTAAPTGPGAPSRRALKRFWLPAVVVAAGLGVIVVAYKVVYPQPEPAISIPASPSVVVSARGHLSQVTYTVTGTPPADPRYGSR